MRAHCEGGGGLRLVEIVCLCVCVRVCVCVCVCVEREGMIVARRSITKDFPLGRGKDEKNTILTLEFKFEYKSAAQQLMEAEEQKRSRISP